MPGFRGFRAPGWYRHKGVRPTVAQHLHEIRDPIHTFVRLDSAERAVLDSRPFQRLRHIHQLALTYLVYPGATHKRFEHSLGVMELADRVFDIVTNLDNVTDPIRARLPVLRKRDELAYWRRVLRMAALCHDVGHLPFSHAAEKELLPDDWNHERVTRELIDSEEMRSIWSNMRPTLVPEDIIKLAIGEHKAPDLEFSVWESILSEIIVGDAFGVDRMDYLLRDSHHIGVAYGRFDHYRLIDTLRILAMPTSNGVAEVAEPALGLDNGGLQSAEALMLARYFMYSQVYFHRVRRIYDIHLMDFLKEWLKDGMFSTDLETHLQVTDNEITAALATAANAETNPGGIHARRIIERQHFKVIYERNPKDVLKNPEAGRVVCNSLAGEFGAENVRSDHYQQRSGPPDFPVRLRDDNVVSSLAVSDTLNRLPVVSMDYVYVERSCYDRASKWLDTHRDEVIRPRREADGG